MRNTYLWHKGAGRMKIYRYAGRCNASGLKIKRIREKREITQPLNQKAISRIEAGSRVVADYELMIFAKVLGVPVADLLKE